MTQSSDVQGNINKIIIVKVKFILTFTIITEKTAEYFFSAVFLQSSVYRAASSLQFSLIEPYSLLYIL